MLLSLSGDLANAHVLPALYQSAYDEPDDHPTRDRAVYPDGSVIEYDPEASRLSVLIGPSSITASKEAITLASNGSTIEMDAAGVRINGSLVTLN